MGSSGNRRRKRVGGSKLIIGAILIFLSLITVYPVIYCLAGAFSNAVDYGYGGVWLIPRNFTTNSFYVIFKDSRFWLSLRNSVIRLIVGTFSGLMFTSFVSYCMASPALKFKKVFFKINIFTMFFSSGLLPFFCLIVALKMYNTFWVYLLPPLYSVYNMIILSNFFRSIPSSLRESAQLDGANEWIIYIKIYMPLSTATLATVGLWIAVGHWNAYMATMVYTKADDLITLQYYLLKIIKEAGYLGGGILGAEIRDSVSSQTISFAAIIISMVPIVCIYPFIQRFFSKGIMLGAVKE